MTAFRADLASMQLQPITAFRALLRAYTYSLQVPPGRSYLHTPTAHNRLRGAPTCIHLQPMTAFRVFPLAYIHIS